MDSLRKDLDELCLSTADKIVRNEEHMNTKNVSYNDDFDADNSTESNDVSTVVKQIEKSFDEIHAHDISDYEDNDDKENENIDEIRKKAMPVKKGAKLTRSFEGYKINNGSAKDTVSPDFIEICTTNHSSSTITEDEIQIPYDDSIFESDEDSEENQDEEHDFKDKSLTEIQTSVDKLCNEAARLVASLPSKSK